MYHGFEDDMLKDWSEEDKEAEYREITLFTLYLLRFWIFKNYLDIILYSIVVQ